MGDDLLKGTNYAEGQQVNAANLNAHVDNAVIKYTAISSKSLKDPAALSDEIMINDDGILKKITLQQISSLLTVPVGTVNDYAGDTAPAGWLMCYGQAVSRVTYAGLYGVVGTAFGAGDGSNTFNLPDCRGRVSAGKDNMGGVSANRMVEVVDGDVLGNTGGDEKYALLEAELASHTHTAPSHVHNNPAHQHLFSWGHAHGVTLSGFYLGTGLEDVAVTTSGPSISINQTASPGFVTDTRGGDSLTHAAYGATQSDAGNSAQATTAAGTGERHDNVQPTIIFNKIIKI